MSDENEVDPQITDKEFSLLSRKVFVTNDPLPVEIDKFAGKVEIENNPLSVKIDSVNVKISDMPTIQIKKAFQKWEYGFLPLQDHLDGPMDNLGLQGYELVCLTPQGMLIFKRPQD